MEGSNLYPALTSKNDSSSDDNGKTEKVLLMKLHCDNWTKWKKFFTNLLIGCGHEEIFNKKWCLKHANEKVFCKKSALASMLLHSCLLADLKLIPAASDSFTEAMAALGETCGENSLIKLGNKLYALICCDYVLGTSIATHVLKFQSLYTSLKSALIRNENMKVNTTMAGIFFLKSFTNDNSLALLIQNIYDMVPFSFEKLAARMNIEHSQTESILSGTINVVGLKSSLMKPNKDKFKVIPTSQQYQNVVPTKGCPTPSSADSAPQSSSSAMSNSKIQKLLEQQIQMLKKLQVNSVEEDEDKALSEEIDAIDECHPDNTGFFVEDEDLLQVISADLTGTCLILDTGASKSTVSNASLLHDMKPVTKHMKTYSGAIDITHVGSMRFGI